MILELAGKPIRTYESELWTDETNTLWIVYYTAPEPDDVWIAGFELGGKVIEAKHFSATFVDLAETDIEGKLTEAAQEADGGLYADTDRGNAALAYNSARGVA